MEIGYHAIAVVRYRPIPFYLLKWAHTGLETAIREVRPGNRELVTGNASNPQSSTAPIPLARPVCYQAVHAIHQRQQSVYLKKSPGILFARATGEGFQE